MEKSTHWKSLATGNIFDKEEYTNHGFGSDVIWKNKKDLPKDEYPYTLITIREEYRNPTLAKAYPSPQLP